MLWLCGLGIVGLAAELALGRHWQSWIQGIAWLAMALLAWAWWLLHRQRTLRGADGAQARRRAARLALLVAAGGLLGIVMHVWGNYDAAPLDAVYGKIWDATPMWKQWWLAFSMRVGPAPALASGALILLAGMVWLLATRSDTPE
jgi:hypothetical protein